MDRSKMFVTAALAGIMAVTPSIAKDKKAAGKSAKQKAATTTAEKAGATQAHCGGADHCGGKADAKGEHKCGADGNSCHGAKPEGGKAEEAPPKQ